MLWGQVQYVSWHSPGTRKWQLRIWRLGGSIGSKRGLFFCGPRATRSFHPALQSCQCRNGVLKIPPKKPAAKVRGTSPGSFDKASKNYMRYLHAARRFEGQAQVPSTLQNNAKHLAASKLEAAFPILSNSRPHIDQSPCFPIRFDYPI